MYKNPRHLGFVAAFLVLLVAGARITAQAGSSRPLAEGDQRPTAALPQSCVKDVTCDHLGNCWFATWGGIGALSPQGVWTDFTPGNSGIANAYCTSVAVDQAGRVWIAHHLAGVSLLDFNLTLDDRSDDRWLHFTSSDGLMDGFTETVAIGPDGRKWFGHTSSISVLNDGGTPFDKGDDYWIRYVSDSTGVPEGFINAILFDNNQCVWAASDYGLSRRCGQSWQTFESFGYVWDLALDAAGHVWAADAWAGAGEWTGSEWVMYNDDNSGLPSSSLHAVAVDAFDNKWFSTDIGVARLNRLNDWQVFTAEDDWLSFNEAWSIDFDLLGNTWLGSCSGSGGVSQYALKSAARVPILPGAGAHLPAPDGRAKADFPAGAVTQSTVVTYTSATASNVGNDFGLFSFDLSAVISGTNTPVTAFTKPYTITVGYLDREKAGVIEDTLALYWWHDGSWELEPSTSVSTQTNILTATPNHMTMFSVRGQTRRVFLPVAVQAHRATDRATVP
jgi:ligand-binding sensor domain-containing protein